MSGKLWMLCCALSLAAPPPPAAAKCPLGIALNCPLVNETSFALKCASAESGDVASLRREVVCRVSHAKTLVDSALQSFKYTVLMAPSGHLDSLQRGLDRIPFIRNLANPAALSDAEAVDRLAEALRASTLLLKTATERYPAVSDSERRILLVLGRLLNGGIFRQFKVDSMELIFCRCRSGSSRTSVAASSRRWGSLWGDVLRLCARDVSDFGADNIMFRILRSLQMAFARIEAF